MPMPCLSFSLSMPCSHPIHIEVPHCPSPRLHPIPSHPIHAPRPIPSHHASSITHPLSRLSSFVVHSSQSTTLGRHRRRRRRRGVTRKRAKTLEDISRKSPCALPAAFSHLKSSVQPLLWYCYCIRALCPHLRWRLMKFRV